MVSLGITLKQYQAHLPKNLYPKKQCIPILLISIMDEPLDKIEMDDLYFFFNLKCKNTLDIVCHI